MIYRNFDEVKNINLTYGLTNLVSDLFRLFKIKKRNKYKDMYKKSNMKNQQFELMQADF